jgi:hypothetical protein
VIGPAAGGEVKAEVAQMLREFGVGGVRIVRSKSSALACTDDC